MTHLMREPAAYLALFLWLALPVLGNLTPPLFVIGLLLRRDAALPFLPSFKIFALVCAIYVAYIGIRAITAGPLQTAVEPTGDAFSLLLTVAIAMWSIRETRPLDMQILFKAMVILLILVFALLFCEKQLLGNARPSLLLGNSFNLMPLLLIPAMLCTFRQFAPSSFWARLGLLSFILTVVSIGGFGSTRGILLVLFVLTVVRVAFILASAAVLGEKAKQSAYLILAFSLGMAASALDKDALHRYLTIAKLPEAETSMAIPSRPEAASGKVEDYSMSLRLLMLRTGWQAFTEKPVFGHGPQFRFDAAAAYFPADVSERFSHLHNDFLTHAVAGGLPAVVLLCVILAIPILAALGRGKNAALRLQIGFMFSLAFSGTALVNNVLFVDISAFSLGLSFIAAILILEDLKRKSEVNPAP